MSRRINIAAKGLALLLVAALVSGILYEQIGRSRDRSRLPQLGKSVDIGGRSLNISCRGTGRPAVVFESGGDAPGLEWEPIQTEVATFAQACSYDRSGIGWSDPGPYPRTSAAIANDLHELLKRADVPPPYVLVGASFGGINSRVYAGLYPDEVAGLVLVDSAHEDESQRAPNFYLGRTAPHWLWRPLCFAYKTAAFIGLIRLTESSPQNHSPAPANREEIIEALRRQPKSVVSNISTGIVLPESYDQARSVRNLGDRPMIVLTAGQPFDFGDPELNRQAAAYQQVWIHEMQAGLARLSSRGRQIVVPSSNHANIPPDAIVSATQTVVNQVRAAPTM